MIPYIEYLGIPGTIAAVIVAVFFVMQIVGLLLDIKGKAVPFFMNIIGYFRRKKQEKEKIVQTLQKVEEQLGIIGTHCSAESIAERNEWMDWVNTRAHVYDDSITILNDKMSEVAAALRDNTVITEEMFVQTSRDRVIDFATKVSDPEVVVSREEFHRIFKVYQNYENFLENRKMTNGEIDINYQIIQEAYEYRIKHHSFAEDIRGYTKSE